MAQVQNIQSVVATLRARAAKYMTEPKVSVSVGYSTSYDLIVHEDLQARHKPGKMAKYLEEPARRLQPVLAQMIKDGVDRGLTMAQALLMAGLRLQRESQSCVPVDTGALRASAFTRLDQVV